MWNQLHVHVCVLDYNRLINVHGCNLFIFFSLLNILDANKKRHNRWPAKTSALVIKHLDLDLLVLVDILVVRSAARSVICS